MGIRETYTTLEAAKSLLAAPLSAVFAINGMVGQVVYFADEGDEVALAAAQGVGFVTARHYRGF